MEKVKRDRSANWEALEKELLLELIENHNIVEQKGSTLQIQRARQGGWEAIFRAFCAKFGGRRTCKELKQQWGRMKMCAKKAFGDRRREATATGGGRGRSVEVTATMERIQAICPLDFVDRINPFDSDGVR